MNSYTVFVSINACVEIEAEDPEDAKRLAENSIKGYDLIDWIVEDVDVLD